VAIGVLRKQVAEVGGGLMGCGDLELYRTIGIAAFPAPK
jgi:hypothetical protein